MADLTQRCASLGDLKDIWGLFKQAASDIPVDLRQETAQESLLTEIMACCTAGLSPIAVDENKAIVGALLVRRDDFEWGFRNGDAVHISYAAVAAGHRDQSVLDALVAQVQERRTSIFASVRKGNGLALAERLEKIGFQHECTASNGWGELLKWEPRVLH